MNDLEAKIEALLFAYGEPLELKRLAGLLETEEGEAESGVRRLAEELIKANRGLRIIFSGDSVQLVSAPDFSPFVEKLIKGELKEELTPASLETLSIVAYLGPMPRSAVEYIRGVNSSFTLRNLLLRGLVERRPHPTRSNAYLYQPAAEFIRHLGISEINELPDFAKYRELGKIFESNEANN
jgi:segregation and condensation protein B